ncbi:MAG TPA: hypothetical protein VIS29_02005 [Streptomyces sp.]
MSYTAPPIRAEFDPCVNFPYLAGLRTAVENNDWAATQAYFDSLEHDDDRAFAAGVVNRVSGCEGFLERVVAAQPGSALARTLLAGRYISIGWEIRSAARAQHVSRDQFRQFHDWLRRAERLLIDVCAEHPVYPLAWTARLNTARGLQLGQSEARRRYDRLAEHHPHHIHGQVLLLQQLCPKWSGSWEAAYEFARACLASAPPGSHAGRLIAEVHIEHWLEDGHKDHLRSPEVRDEILAAAAVSVQHPDYRPGFRWIGDYSDIAGALSMGGHYREAAPFFRALGDKASESPWDYFGDAQAEFHKHRRTALENG